jgi:excisionase family DNA binding protein
MVKSTIPVQDLNGLKDVNSVQAVAAYLGVHPKTILREIERRNLLARRVGKNIRILKTDVEAYLGANSTK